MRYERERQFKRDGMRQNRGRQERKGKTDNATKQKAARANGSDCH